MRQKRSGSRALSIIAVQRRRTDPKHRKRGNTTCSAAIEISPARPRLGTHSNPCDHYGCEGETREIVLRIAVISGCDASPVLELAEHSFDEISAFVGPAVQRIGRPA